MNSDILSCMKDADSLFFQQLGQRIATYRKDIGMTQTELGEKIGVSQPVVASYEVGRRRVPVSALPVLSVLFGVSVDVLLGKAKPQGKRGPSSKIQILFDELDQLPRSQQQRILATMEDMLIAQQAKAS
jgi:transcriptional regulator with XRE-family HTH domain